MEVDGSDYFPDVIVSGIFTVQNVKMFRGVLMNSDLSSKKHVPFTTATRTS